MITCSYKIENCTRFHRDRKAYEVTLTIPKAKTRLEKLVQEYVTQTLETRKCYHLLPFVFNNNTMMAMAQHYLLQRCGSQSALYTAIGQIFTFCKWMGKQPDALIKDCNIQLAINPLKTINALRKTMDDYIFYLKSKPLSFTTQTKAVYSIRLLYKVNNISVNFSFKIPRRAMLISRAITLEELSQILSIATLREKVIIGILAVSGLRTGTLVKIQFGHVKHDLEHGITPLHLAIEPQIAKGMDHSYSTFINAEVVELLKQYLDIRRKGSRRLPPEIIEEQSPLIKLEYQGSKIQPTTASNIGCMLRKLFFRSGILTKKPNTHSFCYELGVNSLRKFFRTQMAVLGVERLYIEYMMGHKRDRYLDVKMVGVEYLRKVYDLSGISVKPPTDNQFALLKKSIERLGYDPNEILRPEFLASRS